MVRLNAISKGPGAEYIMCKYNLLLNYCSNVCFYLMLKAKQQSFKNHGIIDTLVIYRKLAKELELLDLQFEREMGDLLESNKTNEEIQVSKMKLDKKKKISKTVLKKKNVVSETKLSSSVCAKNLEKADEGTNKVKPKRKRKAEMLAETEDEKTSS